MFAAADIPSILKNPQRQHLLPQMLKMFAVVRAFQRRSNRRLLGAPMRLIIHPGETTPPREASQEASSHILIAMALVCKWCQLEYDEQMYTIDLYRTGGLGTLKLR